MTGPPSATAPAACARCEGRNLLVSGRRRKDETGETRVGAYSLVTSACNFRLAYDRYQQTGDWNAARDAWRSAVETAYEIWGAS